MDKTRLAILLNIPCNQNPVLLFCLKNLSNDYEITVISVDEFQQAVEFPEVKFVNYSRCVRFLTGILLALSYKATRIPVLLGIASKDQRRGLAQKYNSIISYFFIQMLLLPWLYAQYLVKNFKCSTIICVDAGAMTAARLVKFFRKTHYFYWAYEIYPNQLPDAPKHLERLMKRVEKKGCASAELVIVTSDVWAKLLRRRYRLYGLKHCLICVCPSMVTKFSVPSVGETVRFYYHGAYQKGRGLKNLIRAMRHVDRAELFLRGIGAAYEYELKDEVEKLKLGDKIEFLDPLPIEELAEAATNFDVGVVMVCMTTANARFTVGFKTFENIAAGLAQIAPSSFQLEEIIKENCIGITYNDCGENEIAEAMKYCIDNKEHIEVWKSNARRIAESRYNIEVQGSILKSMIAQHM